MIPHPMRIALLTHSTNPRGGVVHVTQLGEALADRGHHVVVHAPDPKQRGFGRKLRCHFAAVPAQRVASSLPDLVRQRIGEYVDYFQSSGREHFDVYHAHDGIGGSALAMLAERGRIGGFVRTVHHLDDFGDPYLAQQQDRSITSATTVCCVSHLWVEEVQRRYGLRAGQVTNGVDPERFSPVENQWDEQVRTRFGIGAAGPVFLSIGGIEMRKNSVRLLKAFIHVARERSGAQLVIAGGASLLDHSAYRESFNQVMRESGLVPGRDILFTGPVSHEQLPALIRSADALVFPSLIEGFGLVVLEAMACGTPLVVSRIEPFTEYLGADDCGWADPMDVQSIAAAMERVCEPETARVLRQRGPIVARRFPWERSAHLHETIYASLIEEPLHAGNAIPSSVA
jgi:glycosyltransferase-like protein